MNCTVTQSLTVCVIISSNINNVNRLQSQMRILFRWQKKALTLYTTVFLLPFSPPLESFSRSSCASTTLSQHRFICLCATEPSLVQVGQGLARELDTSPMHWPSTSRGHDTSRSCLLLPLLLYRFISFKMLDLFVLRMTRIGLRGR